MLGRRKGHVPGSDECVHDGVDLPVVQIAPGVVDDVGFTRGMDDEQQTAVGLGRIVGSGDGLPGGWTDGDLVGDEADRPSSAGP